MRPSRGFKTAVIGFVVIFGLLILAYLPLLRIPFVFNDDFLIFSDNIQKCSDHPQYYYFFMIGRPVFPFLACPFWMSIKHVNDFAWARFVNLIALSVSAALLFNWFRENRISPIPALLIVVLIFISPTFQTQVILANSFPHMVAVFFSLMSGVLVCHWMKANKAVKLIPAGILLFLSLSIHPCVAMLLWPVIFIFVCKNPVSPGRMLLTLTWFALICIIYFLFAKIMSAVCPVSFHVPADITCGHKVALSFNMIQSWDKFYKASLAALHLWTVTPHYVIAVIALSLMLTAATIKMLQFRRDKDHSAIWRFVFLLLTVPLSLLPILAADYHVLSYRMISGLTAIVIIMICFSLNIILAALTVRRHRKDLINLILVVSVVVYIHQCRFNITNYMAGPAGSEFSFIKNHLQKIDTGRLDTIHVIRPRHPNWLPRTLIGGDEFGFRSSASSQNINGLIRLALSEAGTDQKNIDRIEITSDTDYSKTVLPDRKALIIDMN